MTSLVPFDFRCVGQVTGLSLRCAPLHIVLPPEWSSVVEKPAEVEGGRAVAEASVPRESITAQLLSTSAQAESGEQKANTAFVAAAAPPASTGSSPSTVALLTPDGERTPKASAPDFSANRPDPSTRDKFSSTEHTRRFERTLSLHDPQLCLESYFALQLVDTSLENEGSGGGTSRVNASEPVASSPQGSLAQSASNVPFYVSEVVRGSSHPNWSSIPPSALQSYTHHTELEVSLLYTGSFLAKACVARDTHRERDPAAPSNQSAEGDATAVAAASAFLTDVCVHRCRVDLRRTYYLGATLEEADTALSRLLRLEEQRAAGVHQLPCPILYVRCTDGIFVPTSCFAGWHAFVTETFREWQAARTRTFCPAPAASDFQGFSPTPSSLNAIAGRNSLAAVGAAQAAAACQELPWSRAPSAAGWRYPASAIPRRVQPRATLGDVKAAACATLAWEQLASAAEQRKGALAARLDAAAAEQPAVRAVAAQCAALRVQLSAAREALTLSTLEVESLRERVGRRQEDLLREEEALAAFRRYTADAAAPEAVAARRVRVRDDEAERAQLRAQLARGRQQRVRELGLVYAVTLSTQYASHVCATAADAKDHVNGAALPLLFSGRAAADAASHLVASSTDDMHEEAVGLGHACHLLLVLSILYSCPLPFPILLGSGQSHVLTSPNLDAARALAAPFTLTDARKYPLYCHRVAERPLMMAGVQLLLRDAAVLATAMGKPERRIAGCADRLGAMLDLLLHDVD